MIFRPQIEDVLQSHSPCMGTECTSMGKAGVVKKRGVGREVGKGEQGGGARETDGQRASTA